VLLHTQLLCALLAALVGSALVKLMSLKPVICARLGTVG